MNILVHMNHGSNKAYLLSIKHRIKLDDIQQVLEEDQSKAICKLVQMSKTLVDVSCRDIKKMECIADAIISQDYIKERLG